MPLTKAIEEFIEKPALIKQMGIASRQIAEEKYDVHKVNKYQGYAETSFDATGSSTLKLRRNRERHKGLISWCLSLFCVAWCEAEWLCARMNFVCI